MSFASASEESKSAKEYDEYRVCSLEDLKKEKGEFMKEFDLGDDGKCLVVRHRNGEITALSHKCTHYGAPLIKGALSDGRIRCPWHGACFNSTTGDIEDFPGVDSLQKFKVTLTGNDVMVGARKEQLEQNKRNPLLEACCDLTKSNDASRTDIDNRVVIVGGGPASLTCAETLLKEDYKGQIIILCKDKHPTYDRPKLSKALDVAPETILLRSLDYYKKVGIEFHLNTKVKYVDVVTKTVHLSNHIKLTGGTKTESVKYGNLVLATGGKPRTLEPLPGWNLKNVFVLRTLSDASAIAKASSGKNVVVVGASFIGMEVASFLASKNVSSSISVICGKKSSVPFAKSFGLEIGQVVRKMHEEKGVKFYANLGLESLSAENGKNVVSHVTLSNGEKIKADVVVVGIGVKPATDFLQNTEISLTKEGFVQVDGHMQTKVPHVYAIGDIAQFPLKIRNSIPTNIQHWQMAHQHGKIAANEIVRLMRRKIEGQLSSISPSEVPAVKSVPFFWTVQFGISIRYSGYGGDFNETIIKGNVKEKKFAVYYIKSNVVVAVATMNMDPVAARFANDLYDGKKLGRTSVPEA